MVDADFNFKMPKIEMTEQSEDGKYGRFVVEPLERGYGLTLGNSLRRIMLSIHKTTERIYSILLSYINVSVHKQPAN